MGERARVEVSQDRGLPPGSVERLVTLARPGAVQLDHPRRVAEAGIDLDEVGRESRADHLERRAQLGGGDHPGVIDLVEQVVAVATVRGDRGCDTQLTVQPLLARLTDQPSRFALGVRGIVRALGSSRVKVDREPASPEDRRVANRSPLTC